MITENTYTLAVSTCIHVLEIWERNSHHPDAKRRQRALTANVIDAMRRVAADVNETSGKEMP